MIPKNLRITEAPQAVLKKMKYMRGKGKYITTTILLACLSKPPGAKKDIHMQLSETIALRERLIEHWMKVSLSNNSVGQKDIHTLLEVTIRELRRDILQYRKLISEQNPNAALNDKKAA